MSIPAMIAVNVGNTRIAMARVDDGAITDSLRFANTDIDDVVGMLAQWTSPSANAAAQSPKVVAVASVNEPVGLTLTERIESQLDVEIFRVGDDMPVPVGRQLDPETMTGVDRLLNAAAAFDALKQACVIVDAGTAITVDFVDGQGTFHGGAIAPGASMQLKALHEHTAALPDIAFRAPENEAFGRSTAQAMYHGVFHGIRGMVQRLVEHYAEAYGAFPMVVATGGDAQTLFADEPLVDRIVPDLTLMGIAVTARHALDA